MVEEEESILLEEELEQERELLLEDEWGLHPSSQESQIQSLFCPPGQRINPQTLLEDDEELEEEEEEQEEVLLRGLINSQSGLGQGDGLRAWRVQSDEEEEDECFRLQPHGLGLTSWEDEELEELEEDFRLHPQGFGLTTTEDDELEELEEEDFLLQGLGLTATEEEDFLLQSQGLGLINSLEVEEDEEEEGFLPQSHGFGLNKEEQLVEGSDSELTEDSLLQELEGCFRRCFFASACFTSSSASWNSTCWLLNKFPISASSSALKLAMGILYPLLGPKMEPQVSLQQPGLT